MTRYYLTAIFLFLSFSVFSQTAVIRGKVTAFHKYPVKNIQVSAKQTKAKAMTDDNGCYEIVCSENDKLTFDSPSFTKLKKKVKNFEDSINVNMIFVDTKKSREYAIGYGIMSEENLTFAVNNLNNNNNDFSSYSSVYDVIVGRFPGVEVKNGEIIIRGESSFKASNAALLVVDGMVVNDISHISPVMISSIDVLKGSAASVYGSRGANGVVMISLKK